MATTICAACAETRPAVIDAKAAVAAEQRRPNLPPPPDDFGTPVPVPVLRKGMDVRVALGRTRAQLHFANNRLKNDRQFYADVRKSYSVDAKAGAP